MSDVVTQKCGPESTSDSVYAKAAPSTVGLGPNGSPITRITLPTRRAHYPGGSSGCACRLRHYGKTVAPIRRWPTFVLGSTHLTHPYGRCLRTCCARCLQSAVVPIGLTQWAMEPGLAIKAVEIGTDELALLHANAGVVVEIGHAA